MVKEISDIVHSHPELRLTSYQSVLEEKGIEMSAKSFDRTDASKLDGQAVMTMLEYLENRKFAEWIGRLRELDGEERSAA